MNAKKRKIDEYLKKVRAAISDRSPEERRELLQSLEEHIRDALAVLAGEDPSDAQVEEVLAQMDPPEFYAGESSAAAERTPGGSRVGTWALIVLIAAIMIPLAGLLIEATAPSLGDVANPVMFAGAALLVVALVMGIIGRKQATGKAAMIASAVFLAALSLFIPANRRVSQRTGPAEEMYIGTPEEMESRGDPGGR